MTEAHVLVIGSVERSRDLVNKLQSESLRLTYMQCLPFEKIQQERRKSILVEDHLKKARTSSSGSNGYGSGRKRTKKFRFGICGWDSPVTKYSYEEPPVKQSEMNEALELLSAVDSEDSVISRLVGNEEHKFKSVQVIQEISELEAIIKSSGALNGVFIASPYSRFFTEAGALMFAELAPLLTKLPGDINPFVCFSGPFPNLHEKLTKYNLTDVELAYIHPVFHPELTVEEEEVPLILVDASSYDVVLRSSLQVLKEAGVNVATSFAEIELNDKVLDSILKSTREQSAARTLAPLILLVRCLKAFNHEDATFGNIERRLAMARNAMMELRAEGNAFISESDLSKLHDLVDLRLSNEGHLTTDSVDDAKDHRYVLQQIVQKSKEEGIELPACEKILQDTNFIESVPLQFLVDRHAMEYKNVLEGNLALVPSAPVM